MSFKEFSLTRDKGAPRHIFMFRYGPGRNDYFSYTDQVDQLVLGSSGRTRVYFSLDRSASMGNTNGVGGGSRLDVAKSAINYALAQIKLQIADGEDFDIVVSSFAGTENHVTYFSATESDIDAAISWVDSQVLSLYRADYQEAFAHGVSYFGGAGQNAKFRTWIILSDGNPKPETLAGAKHDIAETLNSEGSENIGYIGTNVFCYSIGNPDIRQLRMFDNTPQDSVPVISEDDSQLPWDSVSSIREDGVEYGPLPIEMGTIKVSSTPEKKNTLKIEVPKNSEVGLYYRDNRPKQPMTLVIKKGQADDTEEEFFTIWSGRVVSCQRDTIGGKSTLTCEPITTSLRRNGLRRMYMMGCPHPLYGSQCRADKAAVTEVFTPVKTSWNANETYLGFDGTFTPAQNLARYPGGMVWWEIDGVTTRRSIVEAFGNGIRLNGPVRDAHAAPAIYIAIGCNHTKSACKNWHFDSATGLSNIVNYGGQDKIPLESPFKLKSIYY